MASRNHPDLFDDIGALPPPSPELVALGSRIPASIAFGTSTWTYDGWTGDVYHRAYRGAQPARRLEEYARYPLFRTVGIDSAFYEPPSEEALAAYARALPAGFPCVSKVWDRITARRFNQDARWGNLAGQRNPDFLNAALFKESVLEPYARAFRDHAGAFVFEFQAMRGKDLPEPAHWAEELDGFLRQLPHDFRYAVELRNAELLTDAHGAVLACHGVAHVFNSWNEMPGIGEQLELLADPRHHVPGIEHVGNAMARQHGAVGIGQELGVPQLDGVAEVPGQLPQEGVELFRPVRGLGQVLSPHGLKLEHERARMVAERARVGLEH